MGKKGVMIRGAEAKKRAVNRVEAAAAEEIAAALAKAAAKVKAIILSPVPISINGLREAQILAVKLAPGPVVKVCSVAAKDASALFLLLDQQRVRSGWKLADEDLRALEALALAYLLASTAIEAHHPVLRDNLASTENKAYLLALKEWSLLFEDGAAGVPSVGDFEFFPEARNISRLARKVVVKGLNDKGDGEWFRNRLQTIGNGLVTLMKCIVKFPDTVEEMKAEEKRREKAEKERRKKAEEGMRKKAAAAIPGGAAAAVIPALIPSAVANEVWGLRAGYTMSLTLPPGSRVKVRSVFPKDALALHTLLSSQHKQSSWIVFQNDLLGLDNVGASYMLLHTALETHHSIFCSLSHQELAENTGYVIAFAEWVREFKGRAGGVPSEGAFKFSAMATELCKGVFELLVEAVNCNRTQPWFEEKLCWLGKIMKTLMEARVYFPPPEPKVTQED